MTTIIVHNEYSIKSKSQKGFTNIFFQILILMMSIYWSYLFMICMYILSYSTQLYFIIQKIYS